MLQIPFLRCYSYHVQTLEFCLVSHCIQSEDAAPDMPSHSAEVESGVFVIIHVFLLIRLSVFGAWLLSLSFQMVFQCKKVALPSLNCNTTTAEDFSCSTEML